MDGNVANGTTDNHHCGQHRNPFANAPYPLKMSHRIDFVWGLHCTHLLMPLPHPQPSALAWHQCTTWRLARNLIGKRYCEASVTVSSNFQTICRNVTSLRDRQERADAGTFLTPPSLEWRAFATVTDAFSILTVGRPRRDGGFMVAADVVFVQHVHGICAKPVRIEVTKCIARRTR